MDTTVARVAGTAVSTDSGANKNSPQKIREAAGQFESLLIAQMLRHMRETSDGGWMGTGDDQAGEQMVSLAEEQMAQALSARGGLGIASTIASGLLPRTPVSR